MDKKEKKELKDLNMWIGTGFTCEHGKRMNSSRSHLYVQMLRCLKDHVLYVVKECEYRRPNQFCPNWQPREEDKDFIFSPYKKVDLRKAMEFVDGGVEI